MRKVSNANSHQQANILRIDTAEPKNFTITLSTKKEKQKNKPVQTQDVFVWDKKNILSMY